MAGKFRAVPVDMAEANALVRRWHRRHGGVQGYKLALAAVLEAERRLCGVVVLGRPVSRGLDDGWTLEVLRLAGDGTADLGDGGDAVGDAGDAGGGFFEDGLDLFD